MKSYIQASLLPVAMAALLVLSGCDTKPNAARTETAPLPASITLPPSGLPAEAEQVLRERGKAIVKQAGALLSSNLLGAIQARGITNALAYCSVQALPLTDSVGSNTQVTLRRVSHKARNPQDRADPFELEVLRRFQSELKPQQPPGPFLTSNRADTVTFFSPILINDALCLNCHGQPGTDIVPENLAFIRSLYPQDGATGFKLGDLRGAWRVDFPRAAWKEE